MGSLRGAVAQGSFGEAESAWGRAWTASLASLAWPWALVIFRRRCKARRKGDAGAMANENQFRARTQFVATRGVREYRETIPSLICAHDVVLEVGCGWGPTTAELARHAKEVLGTDISRECILRARSLHPTLDFRVLDAFDLRAVLALARPFTAVYMDLSGLSGYRGLLDLIALLNTHAALLRPRVIVVKSGALKHFAQHCSPWQGATALPAVRAMLN